MVITFITHSDFHVVAKHLDGKRLTYQIEEVDMIYNTLIFGKEDKNPLITAMWKGYEQGLLYYKQCLVEEATRRGLSYKSEAHPVPSTQPLLPWWVHWRPLQLSHMAALLRKEPEYYKSVFTNTQELIPYMGYKYIWISKIPVDMVSRYYWQGERPDLSQICDRAEVEFTINEVKVWLDNPSINPRTKRRLNPNAKTGVALKLQKLAKRYNLVN